MLVLEVVQEQVYIVEIQELVVIHLFQEVCQELYLLYKVDNQLPYLVVVYKVLYVVTPPAQEEL
jgi:hypothetical protein